MKERQLQILNKCLLNTKEKRKAIDNPLIGFPGTYTSNFSKTECCS